jgi:RNA-directed DNA polymerase
MNPRVAVSWSLGGVVRRLPPSLSADKIEAAWKSSRDSTPSKAGAAGVDGVGASDFKGRLRDNIRNIQADLRAGRYAFSPLRLAPVAKPSGGFRIIAVPTVRDRLLQRAILRYLEASPKFKVGTSKVSYGFTKGRTLPDAQRAALQLRQQHPWVLQTDIIKFFDRIPRNEVKELVRRRVISRLIADTICAAVDCELEKGSGRNLSLPELNGIQTGLGLRQGMPLSPMLSNLVLRHFDRELSRSGMHVIRYADDIAIFCDNRVDCESAFDRIRATLEKIHLDIPDLKDESKTKLIEPSVPAEFLGVEIRRADGEYVLCAPAGKIGKISKEMEQLASLKVCIESGRDLGRLLKLLDSFVIGHKASMMVLDDPRSFLDRLEAEKSKAINKLLAEVLGSKVVARLDEGRRAVLGLSSFPDELRQARHSRKRRSRPNS